MARVVSSKPVGSWEQTCPKCRFRVEFHPGDIVEFYDSDECETLRYVLCPQCEKRISQPNPNDLTHGDYDL